MGVAYLVFVEENKPREISKALAVNGFVAKVRVNWRRRSKRKLFLLTLFSSIIFFLTT